VQTHRMRKGGEQDHFSFLQNCGWGAEAEGGVVMMAYDAVVSVVRSVGMRGI
jgi:hypothetical protein